MLGRGGLGHVYRHAQKERRGYKLHRQRDRPEQNKHEHHIRNRQLQRLREQETGYDNQRVGCEASGRNEPQRAARSRVICGASA